MNIQEKIKEIYFCISPERKNEARKRLSDICRISVDSVKHFIYKCSIPEDKEDIFLKIVQEEAKKQAEELKNIAKW